MTPTTNPNELYEKSIAQMDGRARRIESLSSVGMGAVPGEQNFLVPGKVYTFPQNPIFWLDEFNGTEYPVSLTAEGVRYNINLIDRSVSVGNEQRDRSTGEIPELFRNLGNRDDAFAQVAGRQFMVDAFEEVDAFGNQNVPYKAKLARNLHFVD